MTYLFMEGTSRYAFLIRAMLFVTVVVVTVFAFLHLSKESHAKSVLSTQIAVSDESIFEESLEPIYERPKLISIPKLSISSKELVNIGIDKDGAMASPKGWNDIGYFVYSAKAGEPGSVVILGHYDNSSGGPAAFWKLKNLSVGDTVDVVDRLGRTYTYSVVDSSYVDLNDPNRLQDINESKKDKTQLILITCGGVWDQRSQTYTKRLFVKALLVG